MKRIKTYIQSLPGWSSHWTIRLSWIYLGLVALAALLGPLIANEKPYYVRLDSVSYYPLFSQTTEASLSALHPKYSPVDWHTTNFESVVRPPIPFSHYTIDLQAGSYVNPSITKNAGSNFTHWLGTDNLGRDVMAGMIRGCRVSLLIGLGSMLLATLAGIPLGSLAAYWGNRGLRISYSQFLLLLLTCLLILLGWFMPFSVIVKWIATVFLLFVIYFLLRFTPGNKKTPVSIPTDQIVMGSVSIIDGFPAMFLILVLVAIIPLKGWAGVMLVIALLRWPVMARYMRAEVLKMKESQYIKAAQIANIPSVRILQEHIIPYAFRPVMISFIFGVSTAILTESTLSFLGIGLPPEEINWGRLLAQSRQHFEAWWLVVFPGCAIFFTLLSLYAIGTNWRESETVK